MSVLHQLIVENLRDLAENPSCSIQASKPNSDARVMLPIQSLFVCLIPCLPPPQTPRGSLRLKSNANFELQMRPELSPTPHTLWRGSAFSFAAFPSHTVRLGVVLKSWFLCLVAMRGFDIVTLLSLFCFNNLANTLSFWKYTYY
jgi:hypothetical protein